MADTDELLEVARRLVSLLEALETGRGGSVTVQEVKTLHLRLAPVYEYLYGAVPVVRTDVPAFVWLPRAREHAGQALAALDSGLYDNRSGESEQAVTVAREGVFLAGEVFDALELVHGLVEGATASVIVIDGYVDGSVIKLLTAKAPDVTVKVLTRELRDDVGALVKAFNTQHGGLEVRVTDAFHDRFLAIDGLDWYHFGASIKDAGRRGFMFSRIEEPLVLETLRTGFGSAWESATQT